jgi:hypothetical protein
MSVRNGIYRIAQLTKWTSRVLGGLLLLAIAYAEIFNNEGVSNNVLVPVVITVGCMAIAEGIAWVLEGFSRE